MSIEIVKPSILEIRLFINKLNYQDTWFPVDSNYLMNNLVSESLFIRGCRKDKEIIAIGVSQISRPFLHSKLKALNLIYYQSLVSGYKAVRSLEVYHRAMLQFALENKIPVCISSSIDDNYDIFLKILEKNGWRLRGRSAYYRVQGYQRLKG